MAETEIPTEMSAPDTPALRLARHLGYHSLLALGALALFAAADSWFVLTGLGMAQALCVVTGILAGATIPTLVHEWFHYLGARVSGADYTIPRKLGLFVYDWNFQTNTLKQFFVMSIGGTVGSLLAIGLLLLNLPADSAGRAVLLATAIASMGFAGTIEWPVLLRTRQSGEPLTELAKTDLGVIRRAFVVAGVVGLVSYSLIY